MWIHKHKQINKQSQFLTHNWRDTHALGAKWQIIPFCILHLTEANSSIIQYSWKMKPRQIATAILTDPPPAAAAYPHNSLFPNCNNITFHLECSACLSHLPIVISYCFVSSKGGEKWVSSSLDGDRTTDRLGHSALAARPASLRPWGL